MKRITIAAATPDDELSSRDWRDLAWLLEVFDEWLLYAEPTTIRELDRLLQSIGASAGSAGVLTRLGEMRQRIGHNYAE